MPKTFNLAEAVAEFNRLSYCCLVYDKVDNALYIVRRVPVNELPLSEEQCIIASKVKERNRKARTVKKLTPTEARKRIEVFNRTLKLFINEEEN